MKKFIERIGRTLKAFWNAVTRSRRFIGNLIFLVVIIFLLSLFLFDRGVQVPRGAALILSPKGDIVEQTTEIMPVRLRLSQSPREETLLKDIIDGIDYAKDDKNIDVRKRAIYLLGKSGDKRAVKILEELAER